MKGIAKDSVDKAGFAKSWRKAEDALRDYASTIDGTTDVATKPKYIGGFNKKDFKGGRFVDSCTKCTPKPDPLRSTLREAKSGSQRYSARLQKQINKDEVLRKQGYKVEWHFIASRTGCTVDPRLLDALDEAQIPYVIHLPSGASPRTPVIPSLGG